MLEQFAGMVSEVFEYPFDLAKVRLQSQVLNNINTARYVGPLDCLMQTWRIEGIRGLYRVSIVLPSPPCANMIFRAFLYLCLALWPRLLACSLPTVNYKLSFGG